MEPLKDDDFTPEITVEERQKQVHHIYNRIEELYNEESGLKNIESLKDILKDLNDLENKYPITQRVECPEETLNDIRICKSVSDLVLRTVEKIDLSARPYDLYDFGHLVLQYADQDACPNSNIAINACKALCEAPSFQTLFGAYFDVPVEKKVRQARKKEVPQENVVKKELLKVDNTKNEEDGIDDVLNTIMSVLKEEYEKNGQKPVDYYRLTMDSSSFEESINNMFYTSFLLKDGRVQLLENDGKPAIIPMRLKELKKFRKEGGQNNAFISSLDLSVWQKFAGTEGFIQKRKQEMKAANETQNGEVLGQVDEN